MRSMVRAFAGDSTITSVFAIRYSTLARSVNEDEPAASRARDAALQFQLEQPGQQLRRANTRTLSDFVQTARFSRRQTGQDRIRKRPCPSSSGRAAFVAESDLLQDIVRGLHNLCTVA